MKKRGFSLTEVLTVLMIVGVIAAMVIPVTITNINQQKKLSMLKKLYSSYNVNIQTVLNEANCSTLSCLRKWGNEEADVTPSKSKHNGALADTRYFNVDSICNNCFKNVSLPNDIDVDNSTVYILNSGEYVLLNDFKGNCNEELDNVTATLENDTTGTNFNPSLCGILIIDINGEKAPNNPGNDIVGFYLSDEPLNGSYLVPMGLDGNKNQKNYDSVLSMIEESDSDDAEDDNQNNSVLGYNITGDLFINGWSYENPDNR